MRELHGYHGEHRHHARDAAADAPATRAHDGPKHAAHDALKLRMLLDPEARKAERLKHQQKVDAAYAEYAARHVKPQVPKPEHASPETRERSGVDRETKAALAEVDERTARLPDQAAKKRKPERSWVPRADAVQAISNVGMFITSVAVALGDIPQKWDAVAASGVVAVVSNVAWANRRWKEKHGDRSEG